MKLATPERPTLKRVGRLMIVSWHIIVRRSVKFRRFIQLLTGAAVIILCSSCEEVPSYLQNLRAGVFPWAARSGYWNSDGVPGRPNIGGYFSDQRACFFKLKLF